MFAVNNKQGGITAVLGPSSGGKSVLMKVLTGRLPTVQCTGEVSACLGWNYTEVRWSMQ